MRGTTTSLFKSPSLYPLSLNPLTLLWFYLNRVELEELFKGKIMERKEFVEKMNECIELIGTGKKQYTCNLLYHVNINKGKSSYYFNREVRSLYNKLIGPPSRLRNSTTNSYGYVCDTVWGKEDSNYILSRKEEAKIPKANRIGFLSLFKEVCLTEGYYKEF